MGLPCFRRCNIIWMIQCVYILEKRKHSCFEILHLLAPALISTRKKEMHIITTTFTAISYNTSFVSKKNCSYFLSWSFWNDSFFKSEAYTSNYFWVWQLLNRRFNYRPNYLVEGPAYRLKFFPILIKGFISIIPIRVLLFAFPSSTFIYACIA